MKDKIAKILFSTRLMAFLFIAFGTAMAIGTFLDAGQETSPTPYSRALIYNAWWFEAIMVLFVINFCGNIVRYKLIQQKKWSILVLHLSFILIIIGAGITRYISFEGVMPIKEGEVSNKILSDKVYLTAWIDGEIEGKGLRRKHEEALMLSDRLKNSILAGNDFEINTDFNGQPVTISYVDFSEGAEEITRFHYDKDGERYLHFVESGSGHREDHYIKAGQTLSIHNILVAFEDPKRTRGAIHIFTENDTLKISSPFEGTRMKMQTQEQFEIKKDSVQKFELLSLHQLGGLGFVVPEKPMRGAPKKEIVYTAEANQDALTVKVTSGNESKDVILLGGKGSVNEMTTISIAGLEVHLNYGSKEIPLPFSIQLNDLIAEKYPGADPNSYGVGFKSYESKVTLIEDGKSSGDKRIYMNNVLDHEGYRFFQASINFSNNQRKTMNDPDITILSVNHDFWGTWLTYIGYFLLYLGLMLILFDKNTRFGFLEKQLNKIKKKKEALVIAFLMIGFLGTAQTHMTHQKLPKEKVDSIIKARAFPKEEAAKFGYVVIQDFGGRMKPINTYASELLRKVSKQDTYEGLDANQALLSMIQNPKLWFDVPIIKLKRGNDSIRKMLSLPLKAKYAAISDFFTPDGKPKIDPELIQEANMTNTPNAFQKDIKRAYEDQRLLSQALSGSLIRIYPVPGDDNNTWVSPLEIGKLNYGPDDKAIKNLFPYGYFEFMIKKDYKIADDILNAIKELQRGYSGDIMPSEEKLKAEVLYNKYDVFKKLFSWYMYAGTLMFLLIILKIFNDNNFFRISVNVFKGIIILLFFVHLAGLITRWYVSGHAPWSNAYESMIYVAFATMLFGLLFGRKSELTIASTAFVVSMILMIAHWNSIDPAIDNLQPVLDSYWLMIHVAVIVGSYGPFALGMILGAVGLILMIFTTDQNKKIMKLNLDEVTTISEMAMTIGLVMLTIGNFLGGQWANESWGRYWGWDPKETWALISIMVYAFVIHMRLVPGLRSKWFFNVASIIAFYSILMTYFGVNFYLVGLHSYASGESAVTPNFVWVSFAVILILAAISRVKYTKYFKK